MPLEWSRGVRLSTGSSSRVQPRRSPSAGSRIAGRSDHAAAHPGRPQVARLSPNRLGAAMACRMLAVTHERRAAWHDREAGPTRGPLDRGRRVPAHGAHDGLRLDLVLAVAGSRKHLCRRRRHLRSRRGRVRQGSRVERPGLQHEPPEPRRRRLLSRVPRRRHPRCNTNVQPGAGLRLRPVLHGRYGLRRGRRDFFVSGLGLRWLHDGGRQQERHGAIHGGVCPGVRQRTFRSGLQLPLRKRRCLPRRQVSGGLLRAASDRHSVRLRGRRRTVRVLREHHLQRNGAARCVRLFR
jgi:hypothetical protein